MIVRGVLLFCFLCVPALDVLALDLRLPDFGDPSAQYLGPREEARLGADVLRRIRERDMVLDDVQLNEYLNSVGQRIAANASGGHPYTFYWIDSSRVNAFAAPGGYIGIHTGLLQATRNEAELAGVVAHEIAHVAQRHITRLYADTRQQQFSLAAALLASAALAAANSEVGRAAMATTLASSAQQRLNFTRSHEQEADRVGQRLLEQSGFDPDGMASFFAYLARSPGELGNQLPDYLRTHPRPTTRMADVAGRGERQLSGETFISSPGYHLAKARARVMTTANTSTLIGYFRDTLASGDHDDAAAQRYGYVLALKRAGRYDEAIEQLDRLLQHYPDRLAFRIEQAELALSTGDAPRARQLFERLMALYPDNFVLAMHYGRALVGEGNPAQALEILAPHLKRRSRELGLYQLYAQAAQRAGRWLITHAAMTEYHYLNGDLDQAIEQAERGLQRSEGSTHERAQLQARLRELRQLRERT